MSEQLFLLDESPSGTLDDRQKVDASIETSLCGGFFINNAIAMGACGRERIA